jgi:hypothetical protein
MNKLDGLGIQRDAVRTPAKISKERTDQLGTKNGMTHDDNGTSVSDNFHRDNKV